LSCGKAIGFGKLPSDIPKPIAYNCRTCFCFSFCSLYRWPCIFSFDGESAGQRAGPLTASHILHQILKRLLHETCQHADYDKSSRLALSLSDRGRCFSNFSEPEQNLKSFVFFKCDDGKPRQISSRPRRRPSASHGPQLVFVCERKRPRPVHRPAMVKCRAVGRLDKNSHRQLRHVSNIGVGETTATAQRKHGGNALQKNVALLDRDRASRGHDDY